MKNICILLFLAFGVSGYGQIINFPDPKFKNALINTPCVDTDGNNFGDIDADLNGDGEIEQAEALLVKSLKFDGDKFSDISGIENFKSLEKLVLVKNKVSKIILQDMENLKFFQSFNNPLDTLNLHNLQSITEIDVQNNQIRSISLSNLPLLQYLECQENLLTELTLPVLPSLIHFNCETNLLTYLDISNLQNLALIDCYNNKINRISLSNLPKLNKLLCHYNKLSELKLSHLPSLSSLFCPKNQLTSLNLTNLPALESLECYDNQLAELDVSDLPNIKLLNAYNNPMVHLFAKFGKEKDISKFAAIPFLKYICTDEINFDAFSDKFKNSHINSYCSFVPGGNYFSLMGNIIFDLNQNGCDESDISFPNLKFDVSSLNIPSGSIIANILGEYFIPLIEGMYVIKPTLTYPDYFSVSPDSINIVYPSTSDTITQDFCITPNGVFRQTNITVIPLTPPARPGFEASYKIVYENAGNQIESGTLNFTYDESKLDYISATQTYDQVADGIVSWNFTDLLPFEKREITVTLRVNRPTDTPAVNAGDKLYLSAAISDNVFTLENTVVGSYDPNDKTCLQGDRVKPEMAGEYVDYVIRFENTGNYAAENIVVKDIIDTTRFEVSSLQITYASHEVYARIEGNKVEFIFENIQLPFDDANNDGFIAFKIKTLPTLVLGDSLKNLADIYFDYNFPIRTNEAKTTIALPVHTEDAVIEVDIFPNPVKDILYLHAGESWSKAEIFDLSGRVVRSVTLAGTSLDLGDLVAGPYIVRLRNKDKSGRVKFIKM